MKYPQLLILIFLSITSCVSVRKYNKRQETPLPPVRLKQDVDYTYKKLQQLHPELYWYIGKPELDNAFKQVKDQFSSEAKPWELYEKLAPAIAKVRQGHLVLLPPTKKYTRAEIKNLRNQKGLFSRYKYVLDDGHVYISENRDSIPNMEIGSRLVSINGESVDGLLEKYSKFVTSDGFNETFQKYALAERWPVYFTIEKGILDSVKVKTLYQNREKEFWLKREKLEKEEKKAQKKEDRNYQKQNTKDYDSGEKHYNRELTFVGKDSLTAVLTVKTFSEKWANRFYRESFEKIAERGVQNLIIDVRGNPGGSLAEITRLYRYLGSDRYPFIKDMEVNSRKALLKADYYSEFPDFLKPIAFLSYPFYVVGMISSTKKSGNQYFVRNNLFASKRPAKNSFKGNLYLLLNGGSFSASSILASKLKSDGRAILIGEESGGANDGNIAGRYATVTLPNSKLKLPIGLMLIKPNINFTGTKKGVTPHFEVLPTLSEKLTEDTEMKFVLQLIDKEQTSVPDILPETE